MSRYRNKEVTADSVLCGSSYRVSGLFRVCFTMSMFNNLEHRRSDPHYLEKIFQELIQTLKKDMSHNFWLSAAGISNVYERQVI